MGKCPSELQGAGRAPGHFRALLLAHKPCSAEVLQKDPEGLSPGLCSEISYDPLQVSVFSWRFKD